MFARRLAFALGLTCFVAAIAYVGRGGYADASEEEIGILDAFYYATVTITTTGYGDIRPESDGARLATTLLVTPARILFLIVLVGTTVEILAEQTREMFALSRWRRRLRGHTIICGYGTKGRAAVDTLLAIGAAKETLVVIDPGEDGTSAASSDGFAVVRGDPARVDVLRSAGIEDAAAIVVSPPRDDAAVLITLTARELNSTAKIVAAVREEENAHLLRQSGANSVIVSSGAAGRLLGFATKHPATVEVLEDLLSVGSGLDLVEREVTADDTGPTHPLRAPVVAVVRDSVVMRFDDPAIGDLRAGDRLVELRSLRVSD